MKRNSIAQIEGGRSTSDQTVRMICREFGVNEEWLRTGEGEMFAPKEEDALDELVKQRDLSEPDRILIEKFLNLKPASRKAVVDYMREVIGEINGKVKAEMTVEISPQLPIGSMQSELVESEENTLTKEAEALYRSSSGYVASADSSASSSTAGTGKTGEVKPA